MESVHQPQTHASGAAGPADLSDGPGDTGDLALTEIRRLMRHRPTVEQAKIALAAHLGCSEADALAQLVRLAQETGTSLTEVTSVLADVPTTEPADGDTAEDFAETIRTLRAPAPVNAAPAAPAPVVPPVAPMADLPDEARRILDLAHVSGVFLRPLRDADDAVTDFVVVAANDLARSGYRGLDVTLEGSLIRDLWPEIVDLGLYDGYRKVADGGPPLNCGPFEYGYRHGAQRSVRLTVHADRVADGVLATYKFQDDKDDLEDRLVQIEEMASLGWAEWNLISDDIAWSEGMYKIFGRSPRLGPMSIEEMSALVLPADLPLIQESARSLRERHESANLEFRIRRDGGVAWVRALARVILDGTGNPAMIRATLFDITERRRGERALESARAQIIRQRQKADAEHRVARELRRAILPIQDGVAETSGLRSAVRYLAAESGARIGGDWYTVSDMPDGRVLIGIGDAEGHGLEATALMARMRSGLGGLSYTGARSGQLMTWLNELVCFDVPQATATAIIGHYDAGTRELTWSRAGHPPPVLVRDGTARPLDGTNGTLLGAVGDQKYRQATTRLLPGDLLLFYTDGLVERRGADIDDGIAALAAAAATCTGDDPEADIAAVLDELGLRAPEDDTCLLAIRVG